MSIQSTETNLPAGWEIIDLGQVGELFCGQSPSRSEVNHEGVGTAYVTGPEQWNGHKIRVDKWTVNPKRMVPSGCIFITVKGAGVGKLFPGIECAIGRDVYAYRPAEELPPAFIRLALSHSIQDLIRQAVGDIPGLSRSHILDHPIGFPPLNEQRRIVAKIEDLSARSRAAKEALDAIPPLLERFRQSVLAAAFRGDLTKQWREQNPNVEPASVLLDRIRQERRHRWEQDYLAQQKAKGKTPKDDKWKEKYQEPEPVDTTGLPELPEGWCWANVDSFSESIQYGTSAKCSRDRTGIPVLRMGNIEADGRLEISNLKYFCGPRSDLDGLLLEDGDLLFNRTNSPELVGKTAVYRGEPHVCSFASYIIRVKTIQVAPELLAAYLNSPYATKWKKEVVSQQVGQANINGTKLAALAVPVPPLAEQWELVKRVRELIADTPAFLRAKAETLAGSVGQLNQSILAKAFRGELVPQDPNDEPASALLERIREREAPDSPGQNGKKRKGRGR